MGKIRKKTSSRGTTHQRRKVHEKARETRKKRSKEAKKNPQWKSKKTVDPGIPNNFPYKDQILAEVAEARRRAAEEKEAKKGKKKVDQKEEPIVYDGIIDVDAKASTAIEAESDPEDEDEAPTLIDTSFTDLNRVIERADVVVQVLDARDPLSCRCSSIETLAKDKKLIFVLSKIDLIPREALTSWAAYLRLEHPTVLFRSASAMLPEALQPAAPVRRIKKSKGKGKPGLQDAIGIDHLSELLSVIAQEKGSEEPLTVALVGIPNTGKTSLVNSLLRQSLLATYSPVASAITPSTTLRPQGVPLDIKGQSIKLIDTPGFVLSAEMGLQTEDLELLFAKDILLRNRGNIARTRDPLPSAQYLVSRGSNEDLMIFYNLPAFKRNDRDAFLTGVARAKGLIKKQGSIVDLSGAARSILREWTLGKIPYYTMAPSSTTNSVSVSPTDTQALALSKSRKELRKSTHPQGLIQLKTGEIETREVVLTAPPAVEFVSADDEEDEDEAGDSGDEDGLIDQETDGDDEEGDESGESEDEDEEVVVQPSRKRKRLQQRQDTRPSKKAAVPLSNRPKPLPTKAKPSVAPKRIANAGPSIKTKKASESNGQAYDFSKFF